MKKKYAFTMAEVMITMVLLGAVAVMTLRNIGGGIQRQTRTAEFKIAFSKLDVAVKSVMAEKANSPSCYVCPSQNDKDKYGLNIQGTCEAKSSCESLEKALLKEMGAVKKCVNSTDESCLPPRYPTGEGCFTNLKAGNSYVLKNGMIIWTDGNKSLTQFAIDVNGRKGPNKWGEDIFTFAITASEIKKIGTNDFVNSLAVLPPSGCLLGASNGRQKRSSAQMLEEISNKK